MRLSFRNVNSLFLLSFLLISLITTNTNALSTGKLPGSKQLKSPKPSPQTPSASATKLEERSLNSSSLDPIEHHPQEQHNNEQEEQQQQNHRHAEHKSHPNNQQEDSDSHLLFKLLDEKEASEVEDDDDNHHSILSQIEGHKAIESDSDPEFQSIKSKYPKIYYGEVKSSSVSSKTGNKKQKKRRYEYSHEVEAHPEAQEGHEGYTEGQLGNVGHHHEGQGRIVNNPNGYRHPIYQNEMDHFTQDEPESHYGYNDEHHPHHHHHEEYHGPPAYR
jgi:hypothetical protein